MLICCYRYLDWLGKYNYEALIDEQVEMGGRDDAILREFASQREELNKQKERMKTLMSMIEGQCEKTKKIAIKLKESESK